MKKKLRVRTTTDLLHSLVKLGLSRDEAACYERLNALGSGTATSVAKQVHILPNAVYRVMKKLEEKGFVVILNSYPVSFQAVPPSVAIANLVQTQEKCLESAKLAALHELSKKTNDMPQTRIEMSTGNNRMFAEYMRMAKLAIEEIVIISTGEAVSDEIKLVNRDCQERGVVIKFIVHEYNENNRELLNSWQRMGLEVKYIHDRGFHLMVFDGKQSILAANNPRQTSERASMVIHSEGISRALRDYFYSVWAKAAPIAIT
jgi:sugar-specific transcriptional regulator TrmB